MRKTGAQNPRPPHEIDLVRGSAYGIFSRKFVEFVVNDRRAKDLLEWSQNTYSPDAVSYTHLTLPTIYSV